MCAGIMRLFYARWTLEVRLRPPARLPFARDHHNVRLLTLANWASPNVRPFCPALSQRAHHSLSLLRSPRRAPVGRRDDDDATARRPNK
uniref:Uncharacterized protein n=1 Tax=Plectus sambesii TaxID=2011161 RepID=A0A914W4L2_9BILA